ncbi:MAG: triose-phosphate isomerase [Parcubacteria group bacterium]|nr:triose-phosphate isomerase [Parcubacteria group bacterium]
MLIVGNWKAYVETLEKAKRLYAVAKRLAAAGHHEIVIAPSAPHLGFLAGGNRSSVEFAAQDISSSLGGAATGEVTAGAVAGVGATYVIVGHSERRAAGETDALVLQKVQHALAHGLVPILCIGERERDAEARYLAHLRTQISLILTALSPQERKKIVVAYEPIWAIGKSATEAITPTDLNEMVLYIRKILTEFLPGKGASKINILYGGSVESGNIRALAAASSIDGFLVGHASTDAASFGALVKAVT